MLDMLGCVFAMWGFRFNVRILKLRSLVLGLLSTTEQQRDLKVSMLSLGRDGTGEPRLMEEILQSSLANTKYHTLHQLCRRYLSDPDSMEISKGCLGSLIEH